MQTQHFSSAYQAKAILGAWHSGDTIRLHQELDLVSVMTPLDSAEEERLELLSEIARELRSANAVSGDVVYGSLLEHLASSGKPARRAIRVSGSVWAAAATALQ